MLKNTLKRIRLSKGITKKELASSCNISAMSISFYESGKRKPTIDNALKIAKALDISVEELMEDNDPQLDYYHGKYRKNSSLSKNVQDLVISSIEEYFNRFFSVLNILGASVIPAPHKAQCLSASDNIEKDAINLRKELKFPLSGPIENIIDHLESVGILTVLVDISDRKFSGINGTVQGYPYIALNQHMSSERIRSTLVHELSHIMFKEDTIQYSDGEEKYATAVSGAFLMPKEDLKKEFGILRTKLAKDMLITCKKYGISLFLLIKRAAVCRYITESFERSSYVYLSKIGWRTNEPSRIPKECPKLLKQLVIRALEEGDISKERACELLKYSEDNLDKEISFSEG